MTDLTQAIQQNTSWLQLLFWVVLTVGVLGAVAWIVDRRLEKRRDKESERTRL